MAIIRELITILRFKSETGAVRDANHALSTYQQKVATTERNTGRSFLAMGRSAGRAFSAVGVAAGGALVSGILSHVCIEARLRASLSDFTETEFTRLEEGSRQLSCEFGVAFEDVHLSALAAASSMGEVEAALRRTRIAAEAQQLKLSSGEAFAGGLGVAQWVFGIEDEAAVNIIVEGIASGDIRRTC